MAKYTVGMEGSDRTVSVEACNKFEAAERGRFELTGMRGTVRHMEGFYGDVAVFDNGMRYVVDVEPDGPVVYGEYVTDRQDGIEYGYYIIDADGITLAVYGEKAPTWRMCNMEGESMPRYATVEV